MQAYCSQKGVEPGTYKFVTYEGQILNSDMWPSYYRMENDDVLDSLIEQRGGMA
jgi:hypothetical protein